MATEQPGAEDGQAVVNGAAHEVQPTPRRRDLRLYFDYKNGFNMWYPRAWSVYRLPEIENAVVMVGPSSHDGVLVEVHPQPRPVESDDLPDLESALAEAVRALPEAQILDQRNVVQGDAIGFEKVYTFLHSAEGEAAEKTPPGTWKKWVRFLFRGNRQYNLVAQASSVEDFDRLRPEFEQVLDSVHITYQP